MRTQCELCTSSGQNLNQCNNNGCGAADSGPPSVTITSPTSQSTYSTSVSPIDLAGTATDDNTVSSVSFSNNRNDGAVGGSGQAEGTSNWIAKLINLEPGQNIITITAEDGFGKTGTDTLTVTYNQPTSDSYPLINLNEQASEYEIIINDPDILDVSYAFAPVPNIYLLIPFAEDFTIFQT